MALDAVTPVIRSAALLKEVIFQSLSMVKTPSAILSRITLVVTDSVVFSRL
jgi:hypothetical protein